jgi:hypothetical protein
MDLGVSGLTASSIAADGVVPQLGERDATVWSVWVGLVVLAVYLALVPFVARTWRATGDEPHYLLTSHSLVEDGDLDLRNNYDRQDYLNFYFSPDLDRQIRTNRAGQEILNHYLGLPLLIAPAYWLAGRFGVLVFQTLLGGLVAALSCRLALHVSRDPRASVLGVFFVAFSPPLFMYQYLVYPELIGALLTTLVIYLAISRDKPSTAVGLLAVAGLVALPWFNRRFVPLALCLALLVSWAWRRRRGGLGRPSLWGVAALSGSIASAVALLWLASQLAAPLRVDFVPPETSYWFRLGRGVGWLVDQQRGLFVFGPIYLVGLWGLPGLLADSIEHHHRRWWVLWPFIVSWGITVLAGGFWIAWEVGPRFLVLALPALASVLAVGWRAYRHWWPARVLVLILFLISLVNSVVILRNPSLPYKSSLPLFYSQKLGLPIPQVLPALSGYARISPAGEGDQLGAGNQRAGVIIDGADQAWYARAGRPETLVQSEPLGQLPYGPYNLQWPLRVPPGLSPSTELLRISINRLGGGHVFYRTVTAGGLPADGHYDLLSVEFLNPNVDRWRTPLVLHVVSSGQSELWAKDILFRPNTFYAWGLPYLTLIGLFFTAGLSWYRVRGGAGPGSVASRRRLLGLSPRVGWGLALSLLVVAIGYVAYQRQQTGHTYDVNQLFHFTGRTLADPEAHDGRAWRVDPARDPPQKATFGPHDIFEAGTYQVSFRMKLPQTVGTDLDLAVLQVSAANASQALVTQPLRVGHFYDVRQYHDFVLTAINPRRQSLSFEVHFLGLAPLVIDEVTVTKIGD